MHCTTIVTWRNICTTTFVAALTLHSVIWCGLLSAERTTCGLLLLFLFSCSAFALHFVKWRGTASCTIPFAWLNWVNIVLKTPYKNFSCFIQSQIKVYPGWQNEGLCHSDDVIGVLGGTLIMSTGFEVYLLFTKISQRKKFSDLKKAICHAFRRESWKKIIYPRYTPTAYLSGQYKTRPTQCGI